MPRIMVIGISDAGPDSLPPCLLKRVTEAEVLCGGQRHLAFFPQVAGERWVVRDNLSELVARLKADAATKRIVVLASGDPYFYIFFPNTSNTTTEYFFGRLWGLALRSQISAKAKTDPKITYSPAILKNVKKIPGMVCPNKTTIKFENVTSAITVKIYVFQSKIF